MSHMRRLDTDAIPRQYLASVVRFKLLDAEQEHELALRWCRDGDETALHELVNRHLRLVIRIASKYRGYHLPIMDLISQGNIGLLKAAKRFDPDRGCRLSTYASHWIIAEILNYVLRSSSLVRLTTTGSRKKLFFRLRGIIAHLHDEKAIDLSRAQLKLVASALDVSEQDVALMNSHFSRPDLSLNSEQAVEDTDSWESMLSDGRPDQETTLGDKQELVQRRSMVSQAMTELNEREVSVISERYLREHPQSIQMLAVTHGVSRQRIRQIETKAVRKLKTAVRLVSRNDRGNEQLSWTA